MSPCLLLSQGVATSEAFLEIFAQDTKQCTIHMAQYVGLSPGLLVLYQVFDVHMQESREPQYNPTLCTIVYFNAYHQTPITAASVWLIAWETDTVSSHLSK